MNQKNLLTKILLLFEPISYTVSYNCVIKSSKFMKHLLKLSFVIALALTFTGCFDPGDDERERGKTEDKEAMCKRLHAQLAKTRKGTDEYNQILRKLNANCETDTKTDYCAELRAKIAKTRQGTDEYNKLMREYNAKCTETKESDECIELRKKLATLRQGTDAYNRVLAAIKEKCTDGATANPES